MLIYNSSRILNVTIYFHKMDVYGREKALYDSVITARMTRLGRSVVAIHSFCLYKVLLLNSIAPGNLEWFEGSLTLKSSMCCKLKLRL